ncbi:MAG: hypothetical protein JSV25_05395 [Spirochaetota bacterium]|nr:MAG: hypothetical protein JSV25_05395 [Spirochaetota bacterium]
MKRLFLLFFFACCVMFQQALASDQKLVHGAGTLPHLTSAITVSGGFEIPTLLIYAIRYDIGLGNRVQLGLSASLLGVVNAVEMHSMLNIIKTESDSDFLSIYINPTISHMYNVFLPFLNVYSLGSIFLKSGVAYEHRFGAERHIGLYLKIGSYIPIASMFDEEFRWVTSKSEYGIDGRVGFQALLGEGLSIALEPWMICFFKKDAQQMYYGGKVAFACAF